MRVVLASLVLLAVPACKSKSTPSAKPAPDAKLIATPLVDAAKLAVPAGHVVAATEDDCETTGAYFTKGLRAAAVERNVAIAKLDPAEVGLTKAFIDLCKADHWQAGILDCVGKNPTDLDTYHRCFERLPTAMRNHWFEQLDAVIGPLGGQTQAVPPAPDAKGKTFEELCPTFVDEVARLDDCSGPGMYIAEIENVYVARRQMEYGGLIGPDFEARVVALCEKGADQARRAATAYCGPGVEDDLAAPPQ